MNNISRLILGLLSAWFAGFILVAEPLRVVVSTPDVASLARHIGGEDVRVFSFSKGSEDPHVVEILPSFVKELRQADLFIQVGLGLENAWLKDLMTRAANDRVKPGAPGNLNLGTGVRRLSDDQGGAAAPGSFHEEGNPHYLLDPVEGLKAARLICDKFVELRPAMRAAFEARHERFVRAWAAAFFGEATAAKLDLKPLEECADGAALEATLAGWIDQHPNAGGIVGLLSPHRGAKVVGDHDLWPYFARRYGLEIVGYLEPSPGVPPTTKHLGELIGKMKDAGVRVVLREVSVQIHQGQFWCLLGPNGEGKSTFIKALLGAIRPLRGKIFLRPDFGNRTRLGFVPQECELNPTVPTTVNEFVSCGFVGLSLPGRVRVSRLKQILEMLGLTRLRTQSFWTLSGGVLLSLIGVLVVARDQVFLAAAVSQSSMLGVATSLLFGWANPALLAVGCSVGAALFINHRRERGGEELLFLAFGGVLALGAFVLRDRLVLWLSDPVMAAAVGMRLGLWAAGLAVVLGLAAGLMLRSTGLLFTFGCLVLPALAAKSLAREIRSLFWLAPVIAAGGVLAGLILAHGYDFPPGQVIVVVLTLLALGAGGIRQVRHRLLIP